MRCPHCYAEVNNESSYCPSCGRQISNNIGSSGQTQPVNNQYNQQYQTPNIPSSYQPISAWGYFGYQILFSIPIIGFILLVVFALSDENINRRNFARSYFCAILIGIILAIVFGAAIMEMLSEINGNM